MNFFEHQAQARRRSTRYVLLFLFATVAIAVAVNLVVLAVVWAYVSEYDSSIVFGKWLRAHPQIVWWTTLGTLGGIAGASLYRVASLASGGGTVARSLGGTLVDASTRDPRLRQLMNVVEEIAIAAGVPVPQVFVLDNEVGVNAFASGFGASDAAITVTRGALTHLTRDELQGVIGHEFSHIFNGDMRLNTRLIGVLFGILFIGLIGRLILRARLRGRGAAPILLAGGAFFVIGYVGVFFGRMIQAAISRSRELLADASAVQFTRNATGLSGALKKIAVLSGANMNFDRLRFVAERAELGEAREALFGVTIPEQPGAFRAFCALLGRRVVTEFNYRLSDRRQAHIFVGIATESSQHRDELAEKLRASGYPAVDLTGDEVAKLHIRYMVGGRSSAAEHERLYRFEFPERPGALMDFLDRLGGRWNISLFHYRNHGADFGRVLAGFEVPPEDGPAFDAFLGTIDYAFQREEGNRAYDLFLGNGRTSPT